MFSWSGIGGEAHLSLRERWIEFVGLSIQSKAIVHQTVRNKPAAGKRRLIPATEGEDELDQAYRDREVEK